MHEIRFKQTNLICLARVVKLIAIYSYNLPPPPPLPPRPTTSQTFQFWLLDIVYTTLVRIFSLKNVKKLRIRHICKHSDGWQKCVDVITADVFKWHAATRNLYTISDNFWACIYKPKSKKDLQQFKGRKQKINQNRQKMKMVMTFFLETGLKVAQLWEFSVDSIAISGAQLGERAEASPALFWKLKKVPWFCGKRPW